MHDILTITLNPALDKSTYADRVQPEKKIRCNKPFYEPGGGGINVSRAIKKLGGESFAWFLSGGPSGEKLCSLLQEEDVAYEAIKIKNWTRENLMVMEENTGNQFRFGMPGPEVSEAEWKQCLDKLEAVPAGELPKFVVVSGSLPPGVPADFCLHLAKIANSRGFKLIVDTSGEALLKAAGEGVYLLKPNQHEFATLVGKEEVSALEQEQMAQQILNEGKCQVLVVSLGPRGAMVASKDSGISYIISPPVRQKSAVGAGDSMVGAMVMGLLKNEMSLEDIVRYGVAAGTAATMTPGSELCKKEDTENIFKWIMEHKQLTNI